MELMEAIEKILKREITYKDLCEQYGGRNGIPKDPKTLRNKIKKLVQDGNEEILKLYKQYKGNRDERVRGYDFVYEIMDMLESDLSQREISQRYSISRDTLKGAIKRCYTSYPELKRLIDAHNERHIKGRNCEHLTNCEIEEIKAELEKLRAKYNLKRKYDRNLDDDE